ncbi:MAG TPA: hypothetical protein VL527_00605 [Dongiaceae bacterium]|jgi:hypothetical protein|nr:hypothetical protein [Dongiaceae bacterium]
MKLGKAHCRNLLPAIRLLLTFWCLGSAIMAAMAQGIPREPFCVDLSKYATAQLTDSLNSPASVKDNNLATLPKGRQLFLKTPFQIDGVLQLSGKKIQEWGRKEFPESITNIPVGRVCAQLDLLHGAGGVFDRDGVTIARLVLHYSDKSVRELEIKSGVHVRDWWGEPNQRVTGTNSALAWTGSNPALKKYGGAKPGSLRIYKTSFKNPQPDISLTSVDYVSTLQNASPFLLGLTVE